MRVLFFFAVVGLAGLGCVCEREYSEGARREFQSGAKRAHSKMSHFVIDFKSTPDAALQAKFVAIDEKLCAQFGISDAQREIGLMDLRTGRLAMIHPDRIEYAASVPKIGILLAYFQLHPEAAEKLDARRATSWG